MTAKELTNKMKEPEAIILPKGWVLIEALKKPSNIISADPDNPHNIDYLKITRVAEDVVDYQVGDIVLDFESFQKSDYEWRGRLFRKMMASSILLATKNENFDPNYKEIIKPNLLIN